jgi:hypothetical protein
LHILPYTEDRPLFYEDTTHAVLFRELKVKAISVTGCGGPLGCGTSRLPHFLYDRFTDGGEIVSLTRRPPFSHRKIPGTHFC